MAVPGGTVGRFTHKSRKVRSTMGQVRWRNRTREKAQKKSLTPAEKARAKVQRQENKDEKQTAISEARAEVLKLATVLQEKFGDHSVDYYRKLLMQSTHKPKSIRKISTWNAFMSVKIKAMNAEGTYDFLSPTAGRVS